MALSSRCHQEDFDKNKIWIQIETSLKQMKIHFFAFSSQKTPFSIHSFIHLHLVKVHQSASYEIQIFLFCFRFVI